MAADFMQETARVRQPALAPLRFMADYVGLTKRALARGGFTNWSHFPDGELDVRYYDGLARFVSSGPRRIHYSSSFRLPDDAQIYREGLDSLTRKIERGDDVRPHLSKGALDLSAYDGLLLDWRIHHLHIGNAIDTATGWIERTGPVLYVRFEPSDAFFIGILPHRQWVNPQLLETVLQDWPHLAPALPGWTVDEEDDLGEVRGALRKGGFTGLYRSRDGKAYLPGSYTKARTSSAATRHAFRVRERVRDLERRAAMEFPKLCALAAAKGCTLPDPVELRLVVVRGDLQARITGTKLLWEFGDHPPPESPSAFRSAD